MKEKIIKLLGPPKRKRNIYGLMIAILTGAVFCLLFEANCFSSLQLQSSDFFFKSASYQEKNNANNSSIVIIGIDDKSLEQLGRFSSWPRSYYARLVDVISNSKARTIAFDILFSEGGPDDQLLASSIRSAGNVILAEVKTDATGNSTVISSDYQTKDMLQPCPKLRESAAAVAHANVFPDEDGIVRRVPVIIDSGNGVEPAFSLTAVSKYLRRPKTIEANIENNHLLFAGRKIPLNENKEMLINYSFTSQFPVISFVDLLGNDFDPKPLDDKIVLIGSTATGMGDYFWTPLGYRLNGIEIHAQAVNTILNNNFLESTSRGVTIASILLVSLVCGLIVLNLRIFYAVLGTVALGSAYLLGVLLGFDKGLMLSASYPPLAIAASFTCVNLYKLGTEQSQKNAITRLFGRYVSAPVAAKVIKALEAGKLEVEAREQEITVLFADARGFTSLSETSKPDEMVRSLNIYLSSIINAVLKNEGIINKFAGDSIMAVWNTPLACKDHAFMAIKAAFEAQQAVKNIQIKDKAILKMEFGIGINTGSAIAGNLGSNDRLEFSVIGDTVNTAARLTGQAPGGKIWIGENTWKFTRDRIAFKSLGAMEMKGKMQPVKVYEIEDRLSSRL
jgi:adenylate cyclase